MLDLDYPAEARRIEERIRRIVTEDLKRKGGAVVAVSGGIDSSLVAALCARALGPHRVHGLFLPENDSSDDSLRLGQALASKFGIPSEIVKIGPALDAMGCYRRRDEAIRSVFPDYGPGCKSKIVLPQVSDRPRLNVFSLVVQLPDGEILRERAPLDVYLTIVASTNMKQWYGSLLLRDLAARAKADALPCYLETDKRSSVRLYERNGYVVTGEATLRGLVLPVGGIKEKVLAAHRAGIKRVIMPARNEKDLMDVPEQARKELAFVFATHMDDVLGAALEENPVGRKVPPAPPPEGGTKPPEVRA